MVAGWVSSVEPVPPYDDDNKVKTDGKREENAKPQQHDLAQEDEPQVPSNFKSTSVEPLASPSVAVVHQKIPAECFTQTFDCKTSQEEDKHMCCAYMRK